MTDTTIDPMDAAVSATIQGTAGQIRTSLGAALPVNPDKEAQLRRYAAAARVPLEAARALPEDVKVQAQLSQVDTDVLARKFPSTAQLLANPDLARIAHDDVPTLTAVETAAHQVGAPPNPGGVFLEPGPDPSYMSQMRDWVFGKLGLEKPSEHKDEASSARAFLDSYAKQTGTDRQGLRDAVGGMSPVGQQFSSGFFDSATGGLAPGNAGAADTTAGGVAHGAGELSGFLLGAPLKVGSWLTAKTLGSVTTHAATDSWVKALSRDVLRQSATLGAAGAVGATGTALDQSTPGAALSVVGQGAKSGAETGALFGAAGRLLPDNTLAQGALRFLGISAAQDLASGQNPFDDRPAAQKVFDYGMNAVFAAHGAGRVHEAAGWVHDMTAESYAAHVADVETRAANEQLTGLADVAKKSALRERAPEVFRQLVADMADRGNLPTIHVDSGALLKILGEAGITGDELRQKMPQVADQLGDALHDNAPTNLLIDVPIEDFATHIAGSPIEKAFLQEARVTPAGGSMADAEAFKQAQKGEMAARVGKLDALHADDQAYHDSLAKMNAQVDEQLAGLKMRPDQLETNSALLRAFYQTQADREGVLPHEFAEKYPVQGTNRALQDASAFEQTVSTRTPKVGAGRADPHLSTGLEVGLESVNQAPSFKKKLMDVISGYMTTKAGKGTVDQKAERFIAQVKNNLLWLHDQVPADTRERSKLWYEGGRRIVDRWTARYEGRYTDAQMAGALAAMSPKMGWDTNVSLSERIVDTFTHHQDTPWSDEMTAVADRVAEKNAGRVSAIDEVRGKTLAQLKGEPLLQGMWIRFYDEAHNPRSYRLVTPEGGFTDENAKTGKGEDATAAYGNGFEPIAKVVSILTDGSMPNISRNLGEAHKVRNFYNNLFDPKDNRSVTIDTHAVAAGLLLPLGASSAEVGDALGGAGSHAATGQSGSYPLYAEAYRRAAAERGVLPREMQSITWEAVRGLFNPAFKTAYAKDQSAFKKVWKDYTSGKVTIDETRQRILALAGGIDAPRWVGSRPGVHEGAWDSSYQEKLVGPELPGGGAETSAPGAGAADPGRTEGGLNGHATGGADEGVLRQSGGVRGSDGVLAGEGGPDQGHGSAREPDGSLRGLPRKVGGFVASAFDVAQRVARDYMARAGLSYSPPSRYVKVDPQRAARIADAFAAMKHDPQDPQVAAAYAKMLEETTAQYQAVLDAGLKIEFVTGEDPYKGNPRAMTDDVRNNNHMWVFSTRDGFGTDASFDPKDNPLLAETAFEISGQKALANDLFRVVHDYFGHAKEGVGFRADGEENAWRAHMAMYSELARRAATTETRGQNSWLNFGPHGETNRTAKVEDTHFADQKIGLLPDWVVNEGRTDDLEQKARGTFSPGTKTISLLKDANLSTFQHELGHFFLDTLADVAARPGASAGVQADMAAFLKWRGIPDLETWHRMSLDEQREHHEAFATGWETYLMKGQAPSLELRGLFSRFRAWMLSVYQSLKGAPGDFTPEVRGVFDRMIASEDAIHNAELARRYMPLFDTPEASGMTPEEWTAYQARGRDATEVATEELIAKTMKDMAKVDRLRTASLRSVQKDAAEKRKVIEREVRAEVMSQPVYRAWSFLTGKDAAQLPDEVNAEHKQAVRDWSEKREDHEAETTTRLRGAAWEASPESKLPGADGLAKGRWLAKNRSRITLDIQREMLDYDAAHPKPKTPEKPDTASKDPTTGAGKLNLETTRELAGKAATTKLQALRMTSAKGIEPGVVADMFGFADGKALADALLAAEPPRAVVDGITEQRMLERHGEIANPEAMARTADELVQNEVRTLFVATELRALKKATGTLRDGKGGASDLAKAAKEVAANTIDSRRIRDISESQYAAAETRSAAQAERAMVKGDLEGAAVAKRDQLLNIELTRAARAANDYVAKALTYLAKFDKASVRESIDLEYRDQIDALLDRADLRKSVTNTALDKRASLEAFVEKMAAAGYEPNIPPGVLDETQRWHYKDMPLVAFRGLVESIKSIEHLGKLKNELRDLQETRAINDLANEVRDTAAKLPQRTPESNRGMTRIDAAWLKAKSFGRSAQASLLKMEQIFDWLDARNSNGVLNRVVMRRFAEAGARENDMLAVVKGQIDELVKSNLDEIAKTKQIFTSQLVDSRTGQFAKFTTKEMLMLAGNVGNDSNLMKLAKGENWDPAEVWRFLHENMTSAHWDFVEGLGRTLESLWPEKLAMDRRLGNTSPQKIEPRAFQTADGKTRAGWYWPMIYDPARSQDVAERGAAKGDALFENIYTKANSDTGRMNTRNENYARPVLLDLDALPRVIKEEIHDVAWREAVIDADRFLSHPTVRRAIIDSLSQEHYDQIRPWLQSIANDGHLGVEGNRGWVWMNKVAGLARTRATIVGLGFRLSTAIVHGLSAGMESVAELGPVWMGKGLAEFANPAKWSANKDFIFERSGEMRHRMNEGDRDVREHLRQIDLRLMDPASNALSRGRDLMQSHAYSLITGLDMASALPTWMGAYLKALHPTEKGGLGMSEADAIYFADKTVRNAHGGTGVKDMAAIQRGSEFQKLFTMFYTFWNHNVNRLMDTGKLIASSDHRAAMKEANGWSDTHMASVIIMRTMIYTFGIQAMHGLLHPPKDGEADSWLTWAGKTLGASAFDGIPIARDVYAHMVTGRDYTVTPAASVVDMVGKTGTDAAAALQGKEVSPKWLKHEMTTLGVVFGLPTGQPASTAQFLWDVAAGKDDPQTAADWWNGVLHGDMKHH